MNEDVVLVELTDIARTELAQRAELVLPRLIVDAGPAAVEKFLEFLAARIANRRTRAAYGRAVGQFLAWCEARGLGLTAVAPLHVAAYIRTHPGSAPTVKQHLAALRMLGDWLVVSHVLPVNPAAAVRGPTHVVTKGATPVLSPAEALDDYLKAAGLDEATADGPGAVAASRPGHDQAAGGGRGSAALDLLPHVSGDWDHGVSVERGDARTRAADRRARIPEDDETLRPDGRCDQRRRDRAHRDLGGGRTARRRAPRDVRAARRDRRAARGRVRHGGGLVWTV